MAEHSNLCPCCTVRNDIVDNYRRGGFGPGDWLYGAVSALAMVVASSVKPGREAEHKAQLTALLLDRYDFWLRQAAEIEAREGVLQ